MTLGILSTRDPLVKYFLTLIARTLCVLAVLNRVQDSPDSSLLFSNSVARPPPPPPVSPQLICRDLCISAIKAEASIDMSNKSGDRD